MIAANFPFLKDEHETVETFLNSVGLKAQLFEFAAEAVCEAVHEEDPNADIADLVLGSRNLAAFRTLVRSGAECGVFQHRSRGGKACIINSDKTLMIMVHNTDAATGLGAHAPRFMSKRNRPGTSYAHSEKQGELDLGSEVIDCELTESSDSQPQTKIDVCIFAEKVEGTPICRIELLVDAEMNERGNEFVSCKQRFGMKFRADDFVASSVTYGAEVEDFDELIKPRNGT